MSIIAFLLSLFTFTASGPSVDLERSANRHVIENVQPMNPCSGTGCR